MHSLLIVQRIVGGFDTPYAPPHPTVNFGACLILLAVLAVLLAIAYAMDRFT